MTERLATQAEIIAINKATTATARAAALIEEEKIRRAARDNAPPANTPTKTGRDRMFR
jgi:hypothetical protein